MINDYGEEIPNLRDVNGRVVVKGDLIGMKFRGKFIQRVFDDLSFEGGQCIANVYKINKTGQKDVESYIIQGMDVLLINPGTIPVIPKNLAGTGSFYVKAVDNYAA